MRAPPSGQSGEPDCPGAAVGSIAAQVIALIGCGYWGSNLLRNFSSLSDCWVKWAVDPEMVRRAYVPANYPDSRTGASLEEVLADDEVEAVVIATPTRTHAKIAEQALAAGKHVLIEKPLALSLAEADHILGMARRANLVVMTGHTFLYNASVNYIRDLLREGALGELRYMYSRRLNLGQVRTDANAWWNLAPHDVSIFLHLMEGVMPVHVSGTGASYIQSGIEDVVFAVLTWPSGVVAHIHVSWLDPGKVRHLTLVGTRRMVAYDDVADDKITILDKGIDRVSSDVRHDETTDRFVQRSGDILLPHVNNREPLRVEAEHFLQCIREGREPLTGSTHARNVMEILEAVEVSYRNEGRRVHLTPRADR